MAISARAAGREATVSWAFDLVGRRAVVDVRAATIIRNSSPRRSDLFIHHHIVAIATRLRQKSAKTLVAVYALVASQPCDDVVRQWCDFPPAGATASDQSAHHDPNERTQERE